MTSGIGMKRISSRSDNVRSGCTHLLHYKKLMKILSMRSIGISVLMVFTLSSVTSCGLVTSYDLDTELSLDSKQEKVRAKVQQAHQSMVNLNISLLKMEISRFHTTTGSYPTTGEGLKVLFEDSDETTTDTGRNPTPDESLPIVLGGNGLISVNQISEQFMIDPWGNKYGYKYIGSKEVTYEILSFGMDGVEDTDDDISTVVKPEKKDKNT